MFIKICPYCQNKNRRNPFVCEACAKSFLLPYEDILDLRINVQALQFQIKETQRYIHNLRTTRIFKSTLKTINKRISEFIKYLKGTSFPVPKSRKENLLVLLPKYADLTAKEIVSINSKPGKYIDEDIKEGEPGNQNESSIDELSIAILENISSLLDWIDTRQVYHFPGSNSPQSVAMAKFPPRPPIRTSAIAKKIPWE